MIDTRSCTHCTWLGTKMDQLPCKDCHGHSLYETMNKEEKKMEIAYGRAIKSNDIFDRDIGGKKDNINPDHYKSETSLECIEAMEIIFGGDSVMNFCICNAWKYIWRWKHKNGQEDLRKAEWYLTRAHDMMSGTDDRYTTIKRMINYVNNHREVKCDG